MSHAGPHVLLWSDLAMNAWCGGALLMYVVAVFSGILGQFFSHIALFARSWERGCCVVSGLL